MTVQGVGLYALFYFLGGVAVWAVEPHQAFIFQGIVQDIVQDFNTSADRDRSGLSVPGNGYTKRHPKRTQKLLDF